MADFLSLKDEVEANVIDLPTVVTDRVPFLVNRAMRSLQAQHNYKVMDAEATYTTTLGTRPLGAYPTDFKEFNGEPFLTEFTSGRVRSLTWAANRLGILVRLDTDDTGYPQVLYDGLPDTTGLRNFEVYPLPDGASDYSDGEYRVTVPYRRYLANLVNDTDTNWFTVNAEKYIVYKATAEAFAVDWDEQRAAVWEQKAEIERKEVVKADKMYRVSSLRAIASHHKGANSPRLNW